MNPLGTFRPWKRGTHLLPIGTTCWICKFTFVHAGFSLEHKDLEELDKAMQIDQCLTEQFNACVNKVVEFINVGRITMKLRGSKKTGLHLDLSDTRKKVVEVVKSFGINIKAKYRAVELQRFLKQNPQVKDPKADGFIVRQIFAKEIGKVVDVVMIRKLPQGEWDLDIEDRTYTEQREGVDNGEGAVRKNQAETKYNYLTGATVDSLGKLETAKDMSVVNVTETKSSRAQHAGHSSTRAGAEEEMQCSDSDRDEDDCDSEGEDDDDPLAGMLSSFLGGCSKGTQVAASSSTTQNMQRKAPQKVSTQKRSSPAKSLSSSAAQVRNSNTDDKESLIAESVIGEPTQAGDARPLNSCKGRGKGKGARIPLGKDELLAYEKADKEFESMKAQRVNFARSIMRR